MGSETTNIVLRKYGSSRPRFMETECRKEGVICLFEVTRPSRAVVKESSIQYHGSSVLPKDKLVAFRGSHKAAKTLVAIHPGTQVKMECNEKDYIVFEYHPDGLLKATRNGGKAKAEWVKGTYSANGSVKVDKNSHQQINFRCN